MKDFRDLLALALVGTSRGSLPRPAGTPLADALNAVQGDPESTLLARAALAGLVQFAGQRPQPLPQDAPAPAPAETRPEAPRRFARHLSGLLNTPVLNEWLQLCAQAGWRVPPEHLPALLDLARHDPTLRENLRPVLGERGAWLSQFNPEWRFTPAAFSEETWLDATEAQKESMYRDLRQNDIAASREFLTQQLKSEKAGVRKRLLNVLRDTWTEEDATLEPLLEETLTDRSSDVQDSARTLLQYIPRSAFNSRMAARAAAMLQQEKVGLIGKMLGKQKFTLHLPATTDPDATRDGLTTIEPQKKNAAHNHFLELVQNTHPQTLADALNVTPEHLLHLMKELNAADQLRRATLTTRHIPTAHALQTHYPDDLPLLQLGAPQDIPQRIHTHLQSNPDAAHLLGLLNTLPGLWPSDISEPLLNSLRHNMMQVKDHRSWDHAWNNLLESAALHLIPPTTQPAPLDTDTDGLDYYAQHARRAFNNALKRLTQRQQLWYDFSEARK